MTGDFWQKYWLLLTFGFPLPPWWLCRYSYIQETCRYPSCPSSLAPFISPLMRQYLTSCSLFLDTTPCTFRYIPLSLACATCDLDSVNSILFPLRQSLAFSFHPLHSLCHPLLPSIHTLSFSHHQLYYLYPMHHNFHFNFGFYVEAVPGISLWKCYCFFLLGFGWDAGLIALIFRSLAFLASSTPYRVLLGLLPCGGCYYFSWLLIWNSSDSSVSCWVSFWVPIIWWQCITVVLYFLYDKPILFLVWLSVAYDAHNSIPEWVSSADHIHPLNTSKWLCHMLIV